MSDAEKRWDGEWLLDSFLADGIEIARLRARVAELEALVQRTLWHAENLHLILPREMVAEFRAALEGEGR